jgi:hypothetical protein
MKNNILCYLAAVLLMSGSLSASAQIKEAYIGNWTFEAPTAPEGYTYGIISFKKDSVIMSFADPNFTFPSNWIKVKSDSIIYESFIDGTPVLFSLKARDKGNVTGNAVWSGGETLMVMKRKNQPLP